MTDRTVERWADAGIITDEQRVAIESFERTRRPRIVISELLVYAGMAVLLAALSRVAASLDVPGRVVLLATLAGATGAAGAALYRADGDSLDRAASVLWFFSVVFIGVAGAALSGTGPRGAARPLLFGGIPALAFAAFYWRADQRGAQLVAVYGSALLVIFGIVNVVVDLTPTGGGLLLAAIGALGLAVSARGAVQPSYLADELFGFSLTLGFFIPSIQPGAVWAEVLAFAAAAFLLLRSMWVRSPELLFTGALSLWVVAMSSVSRHGMGTDGAPWPVLVLGAVLIGLAVRAASAGFAVEPEDAERQPPRG